MMPIPLGDITLPTNGGLYSVRGYFVGPYYNAQGQLCLGVESRFEIRVAKAAGPQAQIVRLVMGIIRRQEDDTNWALVCFGAVSPHILKDYVDSRDSLPMIEPNVVNVDAWLDRGPAATVENEGLAATLDGGKAAYRRLCREDILNIMIDRYDADGARQGLTEEQILGSSLKRRFFGAADVHSVVKTMEAERLVLAEPTTGGKPLEWWVNPENVAEARKTVLAIAPVIPAARQSVLFQPPDSEYDAFLCHASEDKAALVSPFAEVMKAQGLKPWVDAGELLWGDRLVQKIQHGLTKSRFVVVFLTQAFLGKRWPETELDTALKLEIDGRSVVLALVCDIIPAQLSERYPVLSAKLYREIEEYDPARKLDAAALAPFVAELKRRLERDALKS
jgi:hypothetical protein